MELTLKLLNGSSAGKEIKIPVDKFFIGRAEDCHLRPHSDLISRHHCALLIQQGVVAVRDFGSRNGTFVNDQRVVGQSELANGDRLKVGSLEFEVQLSSSVGGRKKPKVKDVKDVAVRTATGKPSSSPDDDISDWLSIDDEGAQRDTRRIDVRETDQAPHHETPAALPASLRETTMVKSPAADTQAGKPSETKSDAAEPAKPAGPGKFVPPSAKSTKDSREAAADALKRLFNARR
ncbi:MAG: FHA domain-containing protein [Pirellulales bacterium]|nr:FHA domain-containing protein [Pirellulales bacterium]